MKNTEYIIYVRSGCLFCSNTIELLKNKKIYSTIYNCDDQINKDKEKFIQFMKNIIGKEYRYMPIVLKNKKFIGGYTELERLLNKSSKK